jgi:hypothetical protein
MRNWQDVKNWQGGALGHPQCGSEIKCWNLTQGLGFRVAMPKGVQSATPRRHCRPRRLPHLQQAAHCRPS